MSAPGFWDDQSRAAAVSAEHARVSRRLEGYTKLTREYEDARELAGMDGGELDSEVAASLAPQRDERRRDLVVHLAAVHAGQLASVLVLARERTVALEPARHARVLGRHRRGAALVVPEARRVQLLLEVYQPPFERSRVKGTHGPSRAGPRARRAAR